MISFVTIIFLVLLLISLVNPGIATMTMVFLTYFRPFEKAVYPFPLMMAAMGVAVLVLIMHKWPFARHWNSPERKDTYYVLLMEFYLLINILVFNRWTIVDIYTTYIIPAFLIFLLISEFAVTPKRLKYIYWAMLLSALLVCGDAINIHYNFDEESVVWRQYHLLDGAGARLRSLGWWDNSNKLSYLANLGIFSSVIIFSLSSSMFKYVYLLPITVFLPTIFLSGSRAALLQLGLAAVVFILRSKKAIFITLIFLPLLLVSFEYLSTLSPERQYAEGSKLERIDLLYYAKDIFKAHPLMGVGFKLFPEYNPSHAVTHNTYVQVFAELGVIGAIIFFLMLKRILTNSYAVAGVDNLHPGFAKDVLKLARGNFAMTIGCMAYYFFGNQLMDFMFLTTMGLSIATNRAYFLQSAGDNI